MQDNSQIYVRSVRGNGVWYIAAVSLIVLGTLAAVYAQTRADSSQSASHVQRTTTGAVLDRHNDITDARRESQFPVSRQPRESRTNSRNDAHNPDIDVRVNGSKIAVPQNGVVRETMREGNGRTSVSVRSSDSGGTDSSSNINLDIVVESHSEGDSEANRGRRTTRERN